MAHAILCYQYNTSAVRFVAEVYGNVHPAYAAEKIERWVQSTTRAIGYLDQEHFERLAGIAWERYGEEGMRRVA